MAFGSIFKPWYSIYPRYNTGHGIGGLYCNAPIYPLISVIIPLYPGRNLGKHRAVTQVGRYLALFCYAKGYQTTGVYTAKYHITYLYLVLMTNTAGKTYLI